MNRRTNQRKAIRQVFELEARPLTPQEVLDEAKKNVGSIGIATVYRNLRSLQVDGFLDTVELPNQPTRYELAGLAPRHHFQCEECSKVFGLPGESFDRVGQVLQEFQVERQSVVYYGRCPDCALVEVPN